jgi:hypothetical protein
MTARFVALGALVALGAGALALGSASSASADVIGNPMALTVENNGTPQPMLTLTETEQDGAWFRTFHTPGARVEQGYDSTTAQNVTVAYELQMRESDGSWGAVPGVDDVTRTTTLGFGRYDVLPGADFTLAQSYAWGDYDFRIVYDAQWRSPDHPDWLLYKTSLRPAAGGVACQSSAHLTCSTSTYTEDGGDLGMLTT